MRRFAIVLCCGLALLTTSCGSRRSRIVIGSKNFTEQLILGELLAQQLEHKTGLPVERRFYLAGTYICQQALLASRIDMYVEYTGTALTAILNEKPSSNHKEVYERVRHGYAQQFGLAVGEPLGFDNTFAIVIRGEDARRLNLHTISKPRNTRRSGVRASATSSWSGPTGTKAWPAPTACASPRRRASWTSVCSIARCREKRWTSWPARRPTA